MCGRRLDSLGVLPDVAPVNLMLAFELLYIKNLPEEEVAKQMGFKSNESGRKAGYKQIKNLKNLFKTKAVTLLKNKGITFLGDDNNGIK